MYTLFNIIFYIQCTCEINVGTCEFLKTSNFIQKIQNYYLKTWNLNYIYTHTIGLIEFENATDMVTS